MLSVSRLAAEQTALHKLGQHSLIQSVLPGDLVLLEHQPFPGRVEQAALEHRGGAFRVARSGSFSS